MHGSSLLASLVLGVFATGLRALNAKALSLFSIATHTEIQQFQMFNLNTFNIFSDFITFFQNTIGKSQILWRP